jgi:3-hydroxyisobutyrate dehydrogenase
VNQVIIAVIYQSVAEGIALARCSGLDPRTVVAALSQGAARSWVLENRASNMVEDQYPLGFRMRLHHKDLCIALETAKEVGAVLPTAQAVEAVEAKLLLEGLGDLDMSGLAREVRRCCGLPDGPM